MTSLLNVSAAFAAGGAGSQSSSPGIPGQKPLSYLGTVLVDGGEKVDNATDIPLNPKFKLEFDKNVVNILFWTNNSQCFSMKTANNENVPVNVTKIDDTVDFSQRQYIFVQPVSPLQPGTSYQLMVSPKLQAKNGVAILGGTTDGQGVTVAFKTAGEAVQPAAAAASADTAPAAQPETAATSATPAPATTAVTAAPTPVPTPTPAPAPTSANTAAASSNDKATSSNSVNPSKTAESTKQDDSSNIRNQSKESAAVTSKSSDNSKSKTDVQVTPSSESQSSNETKKGGAISATTWITIVGAVLVVAWITAEIIARKKRK